MYVYSWFNGYLVKKSSLCIKEIATQVNITYVGTIYTL